MAKFSRSLWEELNNLTPQEWDHINRYEAQPNGIAFVPVAEILRKRGYLVESIVLLEEGIASYPNLLSARVALAKDYYTRGMMKEARAQLNYVLRRSQENLTAQRLTLKVALVSHDKDEVILRLQILKRLFTDDEFTHNVRDCIITSDWDGARHLVVVELKKLGVNLEEPKRNEFVTTEPTRVSKEPQSNSALKKEDTDWEIPDLPLQDNEDDVPQVAIPHKPESDVVALINDLGLTSIRGDDRRYTALSSFRLVQSSGLLAKESNQGSASLETTTLAEIYVSQGMFTQALRIYQKLLDENPGNQTYKARIQAILEKTQTSSFKPQNKEEAIVTEREKRLQVLESLLHKLENQEDKKSSGGMP